MCMNLPPFPNIVTIMQVRRSSTRLRDKVLLPLQGEALFIRQLERMRAASLTGKIVVATTTNPEDELIQSICNLRNIECYCGSPDDLLDRHYQVAKKYAADIVLKIPSDCPLIDPSVIDRVMTFFLEHIDEYDYVSNLHPATFPDGNDVEVMHFRVLEEAWKLADKNFEREHTTPFIWERVDTYRIGNVIMDGGVDYSLTHRWTIDYSDDYEFIHQVYEELYPLSKIFRMNDILALVGEREDLYAVNSYLAGVNWYRHHLDQLKTIDSSKTKAYH
jgi:spore coat polysaccharide biosynthesis protein SpsF